MSISMMHFSSVPLACTLSYHRLRDFYLTPCCIFHMSIVCVYIQKQSRASAICANDKIADEEGKYFLIRSTAGEQVVALLADVIKRYCLLADSSLMTLRCVLFVLLLHCHATAFRSRTRGRPTEAHYFNFVH